MTVEVDTRTRILTAAVACVGRAGLDKTSLEDVAQEAGLSRATVYRYFEGGRDQLVADAVAWEVANYLARLGAATAPEPDLEAKLVRGLLFGHRAIDEHALLQRLLSTERDVLLPNLRSVMPMMERLVRTAIRAELETVAVRPEVDRDDAADYLTGLFLSYLGSPGRWDLDDEDSVRRLVRTQFLAGIVPRATDVTGENPWQ
ncbi:MAG TPA: TetR/AcrR family transcriptional regulator [Acidimicrobiales bacterium]